jgi:hypothetical protein
MSVLSSNALSTLATTFRQATFNQATNKESAMTMPDERTRALLWGGGFLIELAQNESLPLAIRQRAVTIARHFPTIEDVSSMALIRNSSGLGLGLAVPTEVPAQAGDCQFRPLSHSTRLAWPDEE